MDTPESQILAMGGTALSAVVAAFSYRWKLKHERRRTTRTVLYYLLELHHWVYRTHLGINNFPQECLEYCESLFSCRGIRIDEGQRSLMKSVITKGARSLALQDVGKLKSRIADPYEQSLNELAKDDPLLAFDLRGKDNIAGLRTILETAALADLVEAESLAALRREDSQAHRLLEDFESNVSRAALEASIRSTAARCGLGVRISTWRHLRKTSRIKKMSDISPQYAKTSQKLLHDLLSAVISTAAEAKSGARDTSTLVPGNEQREAATCAGKK